MVLSITFFFFLIKPFTKSLILPPHQSTQEPCQPPCLCMWTIFYSPSCCPFPSTSRMECIFWRTYNHTSRKPTYLWVPLDVNSIYIFIPHLMGIQAVNYFSTDPDINDGQVNLILAATHIGSIGIVVTNVFQFP